MRGGIGQETSNSSLLEGSNCLRKRRFAKSIFWSLSWKDVDFARDQIHVTRAYYRGWWPARGCISPDAAK
jgi:hypothetical protein